MSLMGVDGRVLPAERVATLLNKTRQSEMADLARRATRWVGTLSDGNVHVKFHDDRLRNGGDITY